MATYRWKTLIFRGATAEEATHQFDAWFAYAPAAAGMGARPNIREAANRALYYHLTAVIPASGGYELHVTALTSEADA